MRTKIDDTTARSLIAAHLGEAAWHCRSFGAGKFSQTFQVRRGFDSTRPPPPETPYRTAASSARSPADSSEYVLRVAPPDSMLQLFYEYRMMRQEPSIHERLLRETTVPVPPILAHDFTRTRIDRDYLIMPMLPGVPLNQAGLSGDTRQRALREWGGYIAQIHKLRAPGNRFGYLGEHRCMEPQPTWREAFRVMFELELRDIVTCGIYDEETAAWALGLLDRHAQVFDSCDSSRLLHGDIWITNVLVQPDGAVTGLLDFDRACWGDPEWDLAIADYCGVTRSAFWEGYGREVTRDRGDAAVRRLFYLVYEHQKYIVISISERRDDPQGARRYARESRQMLRGLERGA